MSTMLCWAVGPNGFGVHQFHRSTGLLTESNDSADYFVAPGFVDVHIHGAFGIDFMSASQSQLLTLCQRLREVGYEAFLPTTVTHSLANIKAALRELPDHPMILGFHLEGPFISTKHPGAQPFEYILNPPAGPSAWDDVFNDPRLRLITLAPELPGAKALIDRLHHSGVVVSMGHTDATFEEATVGASFGVTHATHTYNAMRPLHHREAGSVGAVLADERINAELIYDRLHVSAPAAKILLKAKLPGHVVAVSDSTLASGMHPGDTIEMWGLECNVGDKEVRLASNGALAGSAITLLDAFQNLAEDFGVEAAIRACCLNPRAVLKMNQPPRLWNVFDRRFNLIEQISVG